MTTTSGPDGRDPSDDHDQDSEPPTPFGDEPRTDPCHDAPGPHPDPPPGGDD
jgi:hypothetical protein